MSARHFPIEHFMDGAPAERKAWDWIDAISLDLARVEDVANLEITTDPWGFDREIGPRSRALGGEPIRAVLLWRKHRIFAAAFFVRDEMNFTQLVRWKAEA
jgi:hypothetical protein